MAHSTCPSCQADLRIPQWVRTADLTCPHCLAKVPNPRTTIKSLPSASSPAGAAAELPQSPKQCPECGHNAQAGWRFCPFCNAALEARLPPEGIVERLPEVGLLRKKDADDWEVPLEAEVQTDTRGTKFGLSVLLAVGILVCCLMAASGAWPLALLVLVGCGVGAIVILSSQGADREAMHAERASPGHSGCTVVASTATGVLGGCALGSWIATLVFVSLLVAAIAAIGNAIETCATCGNPTPKKSR